jgi:hydroxypyruvate isomerase
MQRREFIASAVAAAAVSTSLPAVAQPDPVKPPLKGRVKHSVCRWCYGGMKLEDLCRAAAEMGIQSVELLNPDEWPVAQAHGLTCAVASFVKSNPIHKGFNRVEHHDAMVKELEQRLPLVKAAGIPCQIVFSGNRGGMSDAEGLENCVTGLKRLTPMAEELGVTLIMELLNSKVDHKDYMCDRTAWGAELVKRVGSPRFKLLYDIYHMQIMEGDVIRTITGHFDAIAHFHTGGVPGRREIDLSQELNYKAICEAIVKKGYTGYLGQEFMPSRDAMTSLREAVAICDV